MQVVGREGGVAVSAAWREMIYNRRILTGVIARRRSKVGVEKEQKVQHLINKQIIRNKTVGGEVRAQSWSMVKIPHAELRDTRIDLWSKGQGQSDR
jgi:hypothetical protein